MAHRSNEQRLIDIMFEVALMIQDVPSLQKMDKEQLTAWVSKQLEDCGFKTEPQGSSWGVLRSVDNITLK